MSRTSEPSAASIFGRPMLGHENYRRVSLGVVTASIERTSYGAEWRLGKDRGPAGSFQGAAECIQARIRELVFSLAPILDDAAKRELVKAAGIGLEHLPECEDEAESEVEPLL
jgi:hypothetical protein